MTRGHYADFQENGYTVVKGLFKPNEVEKIKTGLAENKQILDMAYEVDDGMGRKSRMSLWNQPGNDVTGLVARSERIVNLCEELLGGEVYHYHTKLMMKDPRTGGAFVWHQDYGYWYDNGCLYPDMLTVFIAIDSCKRSNGCLQVLKGSHKVGRIDHVLNESKEQRRADPVRVEHLEKQLPLEYVELESGDAVFFHCNLLHRSESNQSDNRRWAFLVAYNKATNNPIKKHHHAQYTPLQKVGDDAIEQYEKFDPENVMDKEFMDPRDDETTLVARAHGFH